MKFKTSLNVCQSVLSVPLISLQPCADASFLNTRPSVNKVGINTDLQYYGHTMQYILLWKGTSHVLCGQILNCTSQSWMHVLHCMTLCSLVMCLWMEFEALDLSVNRIMRVLDIPACNIMLVGWL